MKTASAKIPAWLWLVISYVIIGGALYWSATQPPSNIALVMFFGSLLVCWIPAYAYANRLDIARNKAFWFSQSAGLIAGLFVACVVAPFAMGALDSARETGFQSHSWLGVLGGMVASLIVYQIANSLVGKAFTITESKVEERMTKRKKDS